MSTLTLSLIGVFFALLVWGIVLVVVRERTKTRRHQVDMAHLCFLHESVYKAVENGWMTQADDLRVAAHKHWRYIASDNV